MLRDDCTGRIVRQHSLTYDKSQILFELTHFFLVFILMDMVMYSCTERKSLGFYKKILMT